MSRLEARPETLGEDVVSAEGRSSVSRVSLARWQWDFRRKAVSVITTAGRLVVGRDRGQGT